MATPDVAFERCGSREGAGVAEGVRDRERRVLDAGEEANNGSSYSVGNNSKAETVRTFALWILAHYTGVSDDRVQVASHGGLKVTGGSVLFAAFSCALLTFVDS